MKFILSIFFKGLYFFLTNGNYRTFTWLVFRHGWKSRYVKSSLKIGPYSISVPDARSVIWQYYEIFFKEQYRFNASSGQPVIIDCGSNVGMSILYYKKQYPEAKIIGFEPDPRVFSYLSSNIKTNNIQGIDLREEAVWIADEILTFASEGSDSGNIDEQITDGVKVKAVKFKNIIAGYPVIDFLKIDIEGAEVPVLKDCSDSLKNVRNLFVEYHSFAGKKQELDTLLEILSVNMFRYYIYGVNDKFSPLVSDKVYGNNMDMQLNIFAYR